jgi:hypothetical protein
MSIGVMKDEKLKLRNLHAKFVKIKFPFICIRIKKGEDQREKNVTLKLQGLRKSDTTSK